MTWSGRLLEGEYSLRLGLVYQRVRLVFGTLSIPLLAVQAQWLDWDGGYRCIPGWVIVSGHAAWSLRTRHPRIPSSILIDLAAIAVNLLAIGRPNALVILAWPILVAAMVGHLRFVGVVATLALVVGSLTSYLHGAGEATAAGDLVHRWLAVPVWSIEDESRGLVSTLIFLLLGTTTLLATAGRSSREAERDRARILGIVSHDLRNPLAAASGLAETLRPTTNSDAEGFSALASSIEEALLVSEDLLHLSRYEHEGLRTSPTEVDLSDLARQVAASLPGGDTITITSPGTTNALADPLRVRQIIRNLLVNAQRHGASPIRIRIDSEDKGVALSVHDCGPGVVGIPPEQLFEAFRHTTHRVAGSSTGLGLYTSRRLARSMGGDLSYARVGDESVFTLRLPSA